ncbi:MAG TPA: carboxypeptidase-like regulatory domain-containing protein [Polyangiaceae bacterium]|nr:carboxypeptidase-like regulatory domain-containing protein [Polyangiaceae bacterium]
MHAQSKRRFNWPLVLAGIAGSLLLVYALAFRTTDRGVVHRVAESARSERDSTESTERVAPADRAAIAIAQQLPPLVGRVEDERRAPIAGAQICALAEDAGCCTAPRCVKSDWRGDFKIQLDAPPLTVFASHPEYSPVTESGFNREQHGPIVLTMKAGGASIAGTVLDAAGGPIPGARLSATDLDERPLAVGISDEQGAFRMRVAAGAIRIRAEADGYSEEMRGVDAPLSGIEIRLAPASVINGRVVGEGAQGPVADVLVIARGAGDWPAGARSARSAEDGTFHLGGLRAGSYSLSAIDAHWQSDERQVRVYVAQASSAEIVVRRAARLSGKIQLGGDTCKEGSVTLKGPSMTTGSTGPEGDVVVESLRFGRYQVSVECEAARSEETLEIATNEVERVWNLEAGARLRGTVLAGDWPAPSVRVDVTPAPSGGERGGASCSTDEQGRFSCAGLSAGDYDVQAGGALPLGDAVRVHVEANTAPEVTLRLPASGEIRARVKSTGNFDPRTISVSARGSNTVLPGELRGDEFVFATVPLGSYEVFSDSLPAGSSERVNITRQGEVANLTLTLPRPHTLKGRVIDAEGHPVPEAWVRASRLQESGFARPTEPALTDAEGSFELAKLVPGRYTLEASGGDTEGRLDSVESDRSDAVVRLTGARE